MSLVWGAPVVHMCQKSIPQLLLAQRSVWQQLTVSSWSVIHHVEWLLSRGFSPWQRV
jgi:hypothetical protein